MASVCSQRTFKWSEEEYKLKELMSYNKLLPFPVLVTQGFSVRHADYLTISLEEVYWVHDIIEHPSIVVRNEDGSEYKIPECYEAMVIPILPNGKEGQVFPFKDVRCRGGFKNFKFVEPYHQMITTFDTSSEKYHFGELEIIDVIDELYLVVHSLYMENLTGDFSSQTDQEVMHPFFQLLPAYMPVCVSIGLGLSMAPDAIFFHAMAELKGVADSFVHNYGNQLKANAMIILLQTEELNQYSDYQYIDMTIDKNGLQRNEKNRDFKIPLNLRNEPVVLTRDIHPRRRLSQLRIFFDTGDMGDAAGSISELDDDGYLEPITWLALEKEYLEFKQDIDVNYDDVFPASPVSSNVERQPTIPTTTVTKSGGVTWLRTRFQNAASKRPHSVGHPTILNDMFSTGPHSKVNLPSETTDQRQSVLNMVNKFEDPPYPSMPAPLPPCPSMPAPLPPCPSMPASLPPCPSMPASLPLCPPPPPANTRKLAHSLSDNTHNQISTLTPPATKTKPSLNDIRKLSLDSARTAVVSPIVQNVDLLGELKQKLAGPRKNQSVPNLPRYESQRQERRCNAGLAHTSNTRSHTLPSPGRITNLSDVQKDISCLSISQVADCLRLLQLPNHITAMTEAQVDGALLLCLCEDNLKNDFKFNDVNATKLMHFAKNGWRPKV